MAKTYGGEEDDVAVSVSAASGGGYFLTGITESFGTGKMDCWGLKLGSNGSVEWQKTYGSSEYDVVTSAIAVPDGGYLVAGYIRDPGVTNYDYWLFKLSAEGLVEWQKKYGGESHDMANSITAVSDGGYIISGSTESFGAGGKDCWILKLKNDGSVEWQKTYGGSLDDSAVSVVETNEGYLVACDSFSFGAAMVIYGC